jgi:hypothetical protein
MITRLTNISKTYLSNRSEWLNEHSNSKLGLHSQHKVELILPMYNLSNM